MSTGPVAAAPRTAPRAPAHRHRPRIALDCRALHWPGIGRYCRELAAALVAAAPDLEFYWIVAPGGDAGLPRTPHARAVAVASRPLGVREQVELPLVLRRLRADVLHAPASFCVPLVSPPLVATVHDLTLLRFPEFLPSRAGRVYYSAMTSIAIRRARLLFTVSDATRTDLLARWPHAAAKTRTVLNGVSASFRPPPAAEMERVRRAHGLPEHYLLYVGTWKRHKNLPRLLEAYGGLPATARQQAPLVLVAPPDHRYPEVERAARDSGAAADLVWRRDIPDGDLPALYGGARCVVLPSLAEGFGLPVLEAMACGTPAVVSRIAALTEVAGDGAVTVDPLDVGDIRRGLSSMLDPHTHGVLARRARRRAADFSWDTAGASIAAAYRAALA